jgi:hypothetical protein
MRKKTRKWVTWMRKTSSFSKRTLEHALNGAIKPPSVFEEDEETMMTGTLLGKSDAFWTMIIAACHRGVVTLVTSGMMTVFGVSVELERKTKTSPPNLETICAISLRTMMKMKISRWGRLRGRNGWSRDVQKQRGSERQVDALKWLVLIPSERWPPFDT